MGMERGKDHWEFLKEIDAPMWADLGLEAKSSNQDIDNVWFHTSHPIHQCPSHQLKSAFSFSGEGSTSLNCDLQGPSSPKLPVSVSRSRGKHYRSKKWGAEDRVSINKPHPMKVLSGKSSRGKSGSLEEVKPMSRSVTSKGTLKKSLVCERKLTVKPAANSLSHGNSESTSSCMQDKKSESNASTITSESSQKQQSNYVQVSSLAFGQTSELLSVMRNTLRKSCVTRQASRVEINNNNRESTGCKSSSGKSSIGSSSNPGYDVKSSTYSSRPNKERNPDRKNVGRLTQAAKNKTKDSNVYKVSTYSLTPSKETNMDYVNVGRLTQAAKNRIKGSNLSNAPDIQLEKAASNSVKGGKTNSYHPEAANSKVQNRTSAKSLLPLRVKGQDSFASVAKDKAKEKVGVGSRLSRIAAGGKENLRGGTVSQIQSGREIAAGPMVRDQKGTRHQVPQKKGNGKGLVSLEVKSSDPTVGKKPKNMVQIVFYR